MKPKLSCWHGTKQSISSQPCSFSLRTVEDQPAKSNSTQTQSLRGVPRLHIHMCDRAVDKRRQEGRTTSPGDCHAEDDGWLVTNSVSVYSPRGRRTSGAVSQCRSPDHGDAG